MHGVETSEEAPTTGGRDVMRWVTRRNPYMKESEVVSDLHGDMGVIGFWYSCRKCFFDIQVVDICSEYYYGRHPNKILSPN